jgi:hypothetical protein
MQFSRLSHLQRLQAGFTTVVISKMLYILALLVFMNVCRTVVMTIEAHQHERVVRMAACPMVVTMLRGVQGGVSAHLQLS